MENETLIEPYTVKTAQFEGPFSLLLSLVEDRKLFINDLSLSQVTEDYLNYIKNLNDRNPNQISNFIVVAATLILIKSKSLLPTLTLTSEEESDISSLENRLKLYELYLGLAVNIKNNFGKKIIFAPLERKNDILVFLPDVRITRDSMMAFANGVINKIPKKVVLTEVEVKKVISIEEMIDRLTERIQSSVSMNFKDFSGLSGQAITKEERVVVIVGFLAMLELVRTGILHVIQDNNFEDIIISQNAK